MSDAVTLDRLGKSFDGRVVLGGITTTVRAGDVVGVIGKNGAGKTTLLETLLGFSPPTTGSARIFGEDSLTMSGATKERTRSWSIETVLDCIGAFVIGLVGVIALGATSPATRLMWAIALLILFALLLRARTLRRWRTLDWRVKRPQMNQPMGMRAKT